MKEIERFKLDIPDKERAQKYEASQNIEEHIKNFCSTVLLEENIIGSGNFADVFEDPKKNGLCYKKNKPLQKPTNTIPTEASFLEQVYGAYESVKTPFPIAVATAIVKQSGTQARSKREILVMEQLQATRLSDILEGDLTRFVFPKSFDSKSFFAHLKNFVEHMHDLGIYHCDLFSRNVMVDNITGLPCVIDFGEARYPSDNENLDAYGRSTMKELPDIDLRNVDEMEKSVNMFLDKFFTQP